LGSLRLKFDVCWTKFGNYQILLEERIHIDKMVRDFETLNAANENGQINVTSNYYNYIVLLFITILLIFLLIKFSVTSNDQRGGGNNFTKEALFLFMIIVIFLGLSKLYNNYNLYIFVSVLIVAYIIAKMKMTNK
jgi:heme A synthase